MNVLVVEPGYLPYEKEINGLEEMQQTVGGYIQAIYPYEESVAIVCNEEGILEGLDFNRSVPGGYGGVFGTFFICGLGEENFCSLPPAADMAAFSAPSSFAVWERKTFVRFPRSWSTVSRKSTRKRKS